MKAIHWLGAGLSSIPGIRRLANENHHLTVWNRTLSKAQKSIDHVNSCKFVLIHVNSCQLMLIGVNQSFPLLPAAFPLLPAAFQRSRARIITNLCVWSPASLVTLLFVCLLDSVRQRCQIAFDSIRQRQIVTR